MKSKIIIFLTVVFILSGCSSSSEPPTSNVENIIPVSTMVASYDTYPVSVNYLGTVNADTIKKYSFKVSGKINKIFVENGQFISVGTKLATLDAQDYSLSVENALATFNQAKSAFTHAEKYYLANEKLYKEQAISEFQFDTIRTEYEVAKATFDSAKTAYNNSTNQLNATVLESDFEGYVLDILFEDGEIIEAGYPIIVASNDIPKVSIGITPDDIETIKEGMDAIVVVNGEKLNGTVSNISKLPDENTRTYTANIEIIDEEFTIGQFAEVSIITGFENGISVPITSIRSDGKSYVFVVENNIAVKKYIDIQVVINDFAIVSGLEDNNQVITTGINNVTNMVKVKIMNDGE